MIIYWPSSKLILKLEPVVDRISTTQLEDKVFGVIVVPNLFMIFIMKIIMSRDCREKLANSYIIHSYPSSLSFGSKMEK